MRIAQVAPPWIPVPPYTYGGTELVISWLCDELIRRGHEVTLFATEDSKTSAKLVPVWPKSLWRAKLKTPHVIFSLLYDKLISLQNEFDIIHDHCEWYTVPFSKFLKPPILTTLHHPLTEEAIVLYKKFPNINYVAVSKNQKKQGPGINLIKTIYHGLPIEKYEFNPQGEENRFSSSPERSEAGDERSSATPFAVAREPEEYLLWLSKIIPQKGVAEAIEIAKISGQKLIISGIIPSEYADYFEYRLKPLIDGKQIQFVGAADFRKKVELFKNAKAFLFPVKRPEPFGLVVIESMACGTPVIAFKEGSLPELIEDQKNGFLVNSIEEACQALKKIDKISREYCRDYVKKNFNLKRMVNRYEKLYKKILKNHKNVSQKI